MSSNRCTPPPATKGKFLARERNSCSPPPGYASAPRRPAMELVRNGAGRPFTSEKRAARRTYSLAEFIRDWAYPAGVLGLWLLAVVFTVIQLVSVGTELRAIPETHTAAQSVRHPQPS